MQDADPSDNFFLYIKQSLEKQPEKTWIVWNNKSFNGLDILQNIQACQSSLVHKQIKPGQRILILAKLQPQTVFMLLAILAQGATAVIPPSTRLLHFFLYTFSSLQIDGLVLCSKAGLFKLVARWLRKKIITLQYPERKIIRLVNKVSPHQAALVSHSSGSTGKPKAVSRSHHVLKSQHKALSLSFPVLEAHRDFPLFPNILLHNLAAGIMSIVPEIPGFKVGKVDPKKIVLQLQAHRPHTLTGNVFYFNRLLEYLKHNYIIVPGVNKIGIGGSPVPEALVQSLKKYFPEAQVYIIYGSSEAEPIAIRQVAEQVPAYYGFCVGEVHPAIELSIDYDQEIFIGGKSQKVGEIKVRGDHVALPNTQQWYHTGDWGYLQEGVLYLTARKGNTEAIQSIQHYQIEHVLAQLPSVEKVAAVAHHSASFRVYVQGNIQKEVIYQELDKYFPAQVVSQVIYKKKLPVDRRHFSKIIYAKLK